MQAFSLAQSTAIRQNRPVQVRIYKFQDGDLTSPDPQFRAFQVTGVKAAATGDQFYQISELQKFESTIVMSKFPEYSSIVASETVLPSGRFLQLCGRGVPARRLHQSGDKSSRSRGPSRSCPTGAPTTNQSSRKTHARW